MTLTTINIYMYLLSEYYYVILIIQLVCVWHCMRKGNDTKWVWIIIFLPLIGCLVYFYSEILTRRTVNELRSGVASAVVPGLSVRKLEEQLRFSDTFQNRIALADALLQRGDTQRAIELYESSYNGVFQENEHLLQQMVMAYAAVGRYEELIPLARKMYRSPQFARSPAHIKYTLALEKTGRTEEAEKEFRLMNGRFANYEPRSEYGSFLVRQGRIEEAQKVFTEMLSEVTHLSGREKSRNRTWINKAKDELAKIRK